jgi:Lipocalin-like domain
MPRRVFALILGLLLPVLCLAQQPIIGTYKIVSYVIEIDGQPKEVFGKSPRGYAIITPKRIVFVISAEERKFGTSLEEKAALWDSMISYTGPYRVEGDKLITSVDVSWNENWNGTQQTRIWEAQGNRLTLTSVPAPYARDPSKIIVARLVWEKVE